MAKVGLTGERGEGNIRLFVYLHRGGGGSNDLPPFFFLPVLSFYGPLSADES